MDDHTLAAILAGEAGELLLGIRELGGAVGDRRSDNFLLGRLAAERPADAVLSEESPDDGDRVRQSRVWIVDPLDGTREYGEPARKDWAVHVALAVDGRPAAGAVALPAEGLVLHTGRPPVLPPPPPPGTVRVALSRSRPSFEVRRLVARLGATEVPMGSAGAKAMAVVRGSADIYAHSGGQYEWDSCAPVAVAAAAGLHVSRLDGSPLIYNRPDPYLPDLLICRPELAELALKALSE
ncbi:3'(2'),5'-bisphosphate nucleotidase CysQ [Nocardia rhamnosiphila]|uniref:3'(2'),5'-bisphosphate nucleotidase CysQ n=1 Tax=Nocardia rhamnosiphila TaxID=426716 RepID=A0ABV2WKS9_9NOCA|nr:3'(2'),5'-bisphosphate nucleotidase CysQ [Nocardia rhamnosiphila]